MIKQLNIQFEYHRGYGWPRISIRGRQYSGKRVDGGVLVPCAACSTVGFFHRLDTMPPTFSPNNEQAVKLRANEETELRHGSGQQ